MKRTLIAWTIVTGTNAAVAATPGRTLECLIEPHQRVELRSPVTGVIQSMNVERGSFVRRGQVLAELDGRAEAAALASARYRAQTHGEVQAAETRLRLAQLKADRLDKLSRENFVSSQERDESEAAARVAEADLLVARDNRALAHRAARRRAALLEQRRVRSPVDGIVTARLQHPGELAISGETGKGMLRLAVTNPLRVELVLPVTLLGSVKPGEVAQVEPEPPLKGRWRAVVKQIDRVVDAASGTFRVTLDLPNPDGAIPGGVKCRATFP